MRDELFRQAEGVAVCLEPVVDG
ncbi:MAG: hypothetical protein JWO67_4349, partial [Streptosporangiaceae bacterium]|nr:hypothetical protein [Streptosporangiaceae bacterium]